jgi:hypothetical protein
MGNHTSAAAAYVADVACYDGTGHTLHFTGTLPSDRQVHENPAVVGFDAASGSEPDWYSVNATGQSSIVNPCNNDVVVTLVVQGSLDPACYRLDVITDKFMYSCQTDATGGCAINQLNGQYSDGSVMKFAVSKTCSTNLIEDVPYVVDGHL